MGAFSKLTGGARAARPFVRSVHKIEQSASRGGTVSVLAGDEDAARRLRERLGVPSTHPAQDAGLLVAPLTTVAQGERAAGALARHKLAHGRSLAILIGTAATREELRRVVLAAEGLEPSNVAMVETLDGPGVEDATRAIVRALGDEAMAAARRYPALREVTSRMLIAQTSRRAGLIAASPVPGGADLPVLMVLHVSLLAQLAAIHDRPMGAERALEGAVAAGAGFGWRALARTAASFVPAAGWAARGAVTYASTRALGEAALTRLRAGSDLVPEPPAAIRERLEPVLARLGR